MSSESESTTSGQMAALTAELKRAAMKSSIFILKTLQSELRSNPAPLPVRRMEIIKLMAEETKKIAETRPDFFVTYLK